MYGSECCRWVLVGLSVGLFCNLSVAFPTEVNFHIVDFFILPKLGVCLGRSE